MEELSLNIVVREEQMEDKKVFIVNNEELGVSDFGDTLDEALENFKRAVKLYLDTYPDKREALVKEKTQPILVSRILV
jgi:predicted RNase H-like HicB family nuclease